MRYVPITPGSSRGALEKSRNISVAVDLNDRKTYEGWKMQVVSVLEC